MRILYHHRTQSEDAQGIHINEMVKAFRDLGHEVEMVSLVESQGESGKKTRGGAWQWLVNLAPSWLYELLSLTYNLYGYRCLAQAIRQRRADLIYERYSLNTFCGIWASRRFGVPLVLEVNAPLAYEQEKLDKLTFKRLARFSERWICSNSACTIVVSEEMGKILQKEGVSKGDLVVMPNGIDSQKFHPEISGEMLRRKYGLEGKQVIGFVGWFRKWHGLEMLLEIMHESGLGEKGVRLLLVGDGPAYADLYSYAETHELLSSVIFTGPVQRHEIPAHIAAMDIAVQPQANGYACPMKIFEYMGMGKCIVAPDQSNIREILWDRVNAYLFQPQDKDSLRQALLEMLDDSSRRIAVGKKAYATVLERGFLWQANAERALRLIFGKQEARTGKAEMREPKEVFT